MQHSDGHHSCTCSNQNNQGILSLFGQIYSIFPGGTHQYLTDEGDPYSPGRKYLKLALLAATCQQPEIMVLSVMWFAM